MTPAAAAAKGAKWGALLALAYGLLFIGFGSIRYVLDVTVAPPDAGLWLHALGGAVSLAVASLGIALVMALPAAAIGAAVALAAALINRVWMARSGASHAVAAGLGAAAAAIVLLHAALWAGGMWTWGSLLSPAYLFWLGAPVLIMLAAAARVGSIAQLSPGLPTPALRRGTIA